MMTTHLKQKALVLALLGSVASVGYAGFVEEADDSNPFSTNVQVKIYNSEPGRVEYAYGMGKDQPLSEALAQIVPKKYAVQTIEVEAWMRTPVSWTGKKEWIVVLKDVVASVPQVNVDIDMAAKTVTLRKKAGAVSHSVTAPMVTESKIWTVRTTDKTIRRTLLRWGKEAGYSVVWDVMQDISIDTDATFTGNFEDAVKAVLEAIAASEFPVEAVAYDNKVIRIVKTARETKTGENQ